MYLMYLDCCLDFVHISFYRQLDFPSEPGVANEIFTRFSENSCFLKKVKSEAGQLPRSCLIFGQNLRLKVKQPSLLFGFCLLAVYPV